MPKYELFTTAEVPTFDALRSYVGKSQSVCVSTVTTGGVFVYDPADSSTADDGEDTIVANNSKRWKRVSPSADGVTTAQAAAEAAQAAAEAARDIAIAGANAYTTIAAGLAASSSGQVFLVTTDDPNVYTVYEDNAGSEVLIGTLNIANGELIEETYGPLAWAVRDANGNAALGVEEDGTAVAQKLRVNQLEAAMINTGRYAVVTNTDYAGGADPTGVVNADAAFAAAIASGWNTIVIPDDATFLLATALTLPDGMEVRGEGWGSVLRWTADDTLITLGSRSRVRDLKIQGDGKASGKTLQTGILADAKTGWQIKDVWLDAMGGAHASGGGAFVATDLSTLNRSGGRIESVRLTDNATGIALIDLGEYVLVSNTDGTGNNTAIYTNSGNFRMAGLNLTDNGTGLEVAAGGNDSHGTVSCSQINHNTTNLSVGAIINGLTLQGVHFYAGAITIAGSTGIDFIGCHLAVGTLTLTGVSTVAVRGGRFPQSPDADALVQTLNGNVIDTSATPFNF